MNKKKASASKRKQKKFPKYKFPSKNENGLDSDSIFQFAGKPFRWWWTLVKPVKKRFLFAFILTAASMVLVTVVPTILGMFVDDVYIDGDLSKVLPYFIIIVAVPFIRSILRLSYRYVLEWCSQDLLMRLRAGVYRHLQRMDIPFYDKTGVGDIMARMTGDLDMVRHFTSYVLLTVFEQSVLFIAGAVIIFYVNPVLALATMVLAPFILIIANRFRKEIRPVWAAVRHRFSRLNAAVSQNIAGYRVVKAFDRADYETDKFEKENEEFRNINMESARIFSKYLPVLDGLANFLVIPVILVGGILVINDQMSLGGLVTFNGLLFVISLPMRMMGGLINEIQRFSASGEKIIELLMRRPVIEPDRKAGKKKKETKIAVEFKNVSFEYPEYGNRERVPEGAEVLKDVCFSVRKGEKIGIVGATGSGKTTLINLMMRFYDPNEGEIIIDGKDIKEYPIKNLRKKIGTAMQDVFLFSDTVEGNIAYGDIKASLEEVRAAARTAKADEFIRKMDKGYDTVVGERGVGLSGGQKQRIALARALLVDPDILILDDTTSAIDMETEHEIQMGLEEAFADKTVFIIAHRLSSVRKADRIFVIQDKTVKEQGSHSELLEMKGIYYNIYSIQRGE